MARADGICMLYLHDIWSALCGICGIVELILGMYMLGKLECAKVLRWQMVSDRCAFVFFFMLLTVTPLVTFHLSGCCAALRASRNEMAWTACVEEDEWIECERIKILRRSTRHLHRWMHERAACLGDVRCGLVRCILMTFVVFCAIFVQ